MFLAVVAQGEKKFRGMRSKSEKSIDSRINGHTYISYLWNP